MHLEAFDSSTKHTETLDMVRATQFDVQEKTLPVILLDHVERFSRSGRVSIEYSFTCHDRSNHPASSNGSI